MIVFGWLRNALRKFHEAGEIADHLRDENSATIMDLAICAERECNPTQARAVAEALDSVSVNLTLRLKGDTDKFKNVGGIK